MRREEEEAHKILREQQLRGKEEAEIQHVEVSRSHTQQLLQQQQHQPHSHEIQQQRQQQWRQQQQQEQRRRLA